MTTAPPADRSLLPIVASCSLLLVAHRVELGLDRWHELAALFIFEDRVDMIVKVLWPGGADDQRVDCRIAEQPEIVELNRRELP
eukprot:COSAG02_NODE_3049_length_7469_cov_357.503121_6_plen_84_part_00